MRCAAVAKIAIILGCALSIAEQQAWAQIRRVGPGSTVPGDILRGDGVFLQGMGWYELNDAKAMSINADTAIRWNQELSRQYAEYANAQSAAFARKKAGQKLKADALKRMQAERQAQLRTSPSTADIESGAALNALLFDLSDPSILPSVWRSAQVPLPDDLSIQSLVFRFTPKPGARGSASLSRGVIALARLDMDGRWPTALGMESLAAERKSYEEAYANLRDLILEEKFDLQAVQRMDRALDALKARVALEVPPERGFRAAAARLVQDMKDATQMFDAETVDYAREMISDTEDHEAHTVGELLAFMRKYRLIFADVERVSGGGEQYGQLYGLLQQQKQALGIKDKDSIAVPEEDQLPAGSIWGGLLGGDRVTLTIIDCKNGEFQGRFETKRQVRDIKGTYKGGQIHWFAADTIAIVGNKGRDNTGTVVGDTMSLSFSGGGFVKGSGSYVLRLGK